MSNENLSRALAVSLVALSVAELTVLGALFVAIVKYVGSCP